MPFSKYVSTATSRINTRVFVNSSWPCRNVNRPDHRQLHLTGTRSTLEKEAEEIRNEETSNEEAKNEVTGNEETGHASNVLQLVQRLQRPQRSCWIDLMIFVFFRFMIQSLGLRELNHELQHCVDKLWNIMICTIQCGTCSLDNAAWILVNLLSKITLINWIMFRNS